MKRQTLKISIIILVLTFVLTGCSKDNNDSSDLTPTPVSESVVTPMATATDQPTATTQPTPEATSEPTPEVSQEPISTPEATPTYEAIVELTEEQKQEMLALADSYPLVTCEGLISDINNDCGRIIVAYYMYIGKEDRELRVAMMTDTETAANTFGGEWVELDMQGIVECECSYGKLTTEEILDFWLSGSEPELFVLEVHGIDYSDISVDMSPNPTFVEYIKHKLRRGDFMTGQTLPDGKWHGDLSWPA